MIPFNKPYLHGRELVYIAQAVASGKISGDGAFTKKCSEFFEQKYAVHKALMTTSCTDALEMAAILLNIKPGDEVIIPSYTFVSTANAFVLRGATIVFADSMRNNPNIDPETLESLLTSRTRAIVVVHYAGFACDMAPICSLAKKHGIAVVEDAAQAITGLYRNENLGSIGALGAFSFHETKNVISGEGGMLAVNDVSLCERAEVIREKGTNRSAFFRGEIDKYGWVDIGSSFLPSEIVSAFLYAQLEEVDRIQAKRIQIWEKYWDAFSNLARQFTFDIPNIPDYATNNGHMFYLVLDGLDRRTAFIEKMKTLNVQTVFHYQSLHSSSYYSSKHDGRHLPNSDRFASSLVRLPLYYEMTDQQVNKVIESVQAVCEIIY